MLFSKDLGWRQQRHLTIVLNGEQRRHQSDDRLAAPDIPLQQPIHRLRAEKIIADFAQDPPLRCGELVGEHLGQRLGETMIDSKGDTSFKSDALPFESEAEFEEEKFVKG